MINFFIILIVTLVSSFFVSLFLSIISCGGGNDWSCWNLLCPVVWFRTISGACVLGIIYFSYLLIGEIL